MAMPSKATMFKIVGFIAVALAVFFVTRIVVLKRAGVDVSLTTIFFGKGVGSECVFNDDNPCGSEKLVCDEDTSKCVAVETS